MYSRLQCILKAKQMRPLVPFLVSLIVLLSACGGSSSDKSPPAAARQSYLGFSPWPYDSTQSAVDWTWGAIRSDGDIISQHLEEGVPWPEALTGAPFPASFAQMLVDRRNRANGQRILVQINPLNLGRDGLADLRTQNVINAALPAPWSSYAFNHPDVLAAYRNFALRVADALAPDVLQIGIEVNELRRKQPTLWNQYVELHCSTYNAIKMARPSLTVTVSILAPALFPEYSAEYNLADQQAALDDLAPCTDQAAFSVHPFISGLLADSLPNSYFDTLFNRLPPTLRGKPKAISETSYPAQVWSMSVNGTTLTWHGSPTKQQQYVGLMLDAAQRHQLRYVIWYSVRDYDALWEGALGRDQLSLLWRDTGLYDEAGAARDALVLWREALARPIRR
ncbi:hypothetical protein [Piscinibacter sp. HJYY11]|uniref:hypothetical protein n=1 Tax=Piscinibacter sp. HJYY11 TaxID=2801333 RepID=UPI00191F926E|nr:hypothetical protein [Piscinibacter sp. HJYY11]MBL0729610.1 hypothetical protein [Piscinibacter sp. HJYY11]